MLIKVWRKQEFFHHYQVVKMQLVKGKRQHVTYQHLIRRHHHLLSLVDLGDRVQLSFRLIDEEQLWQKIQVQDEFFWLLIQQQRLVE